MTPARQELVRLALEMPDEGIATCARAMIWICPDLVRAEPADADKLRHAQRMASLELLGTFYDLMARLPDDARGIALRCLRGQVECSASIAADHAPRPARFVGNVVDLFSAKQG